MMPHWFSFYIQNRHNISRKIAKFVSTFYLEDRAFLSSLRKCLQNGLDIQTVSPPELLPSFNYVCFFWDRI
ncbi:hypothetical protein E2C01_049188 [Portunus trituberculatus]|uniref:Uncharacterized protein n=1 Tax=Portunus trituberculatus TaxID=210409 RepID=A0A5B7GCH3_PORTR|nr:hypothetical protein [Portunus trituberculatus]